MNSLNWKKVLISGVVFVVLAVALVAGVYLVRKPQSQDIRSKAAGDLNCIVKWASNCDGSLSPANGSTISNLKPHFHWVFGGYDDVACSPSLTNPPYDCAGYGARVVLFEGTNQIGASAGDITTNYATLFNLEVGNLQMSDWARANGYTGSTNEPNYLNELKPNTTYTWNIVVRYRPKAGCTDCSDNVHPGGPSWTFTTGSGTSTTPDCTSLTTTADLNNFQVGTEYSFQLTAGGTAPITSVEMSVYGSSCSNELRTYAPQTVSGSGTYTFKWTPTQAGTFTAYGRIWNDGIAECRADCVDGPPRYLCSHASACKLTGTVKTPTQTVGCNETCDATHLCPSGLSCDTVSGTCRKPECSTQTSCVCPITVGCNQTCNTTTLLCSSQYDCTAGRCVSKVCPTTQDSSCACPVPAGSCQKVTPSKDLNTVKIGDTVTFTGYGNLTNPPTSDSIDKINFIISKDGAEASNTEVATTLDSAGVWKATKDFPITSPGSYSVRIRVHWLGTNKDVWLE